MSGKSSSHPIALGSQMSRAAILLILVLVVVMGVLAALSFMDTEVQPKPVEKPIPNEKLGL